MNTILQIPFSHLDKNGIIKVEYIQNPGAEVSGFDAFKDLGFNLELCKLYPTINAKIEQYDGSGYRKYMAWIQFVTSTRYEKSNDSPNIYTVVDSAPFFAVGYPPELYDAPCCNLNDSDKLIFFAETFLTTIPSKMNGDIVSFLAGFEWVYEEYDIEGIRKVDILPCKQTDGYAWNKHINLLRTDFPQYKYSECQTK